MLVVRSFAGAYLVDELAKDDVVEPAVANAWNIFTHTLADRAWVWIVLGLVTLVEVWFLGESRCAAEARAAAAPRPQARPMTYAVAVAPRWRSPSSPCSSRAVAMAPSLSPSSSPEWRSSETASCGPHRGPTRGGRGVRDAAAEVRGPGRRPRHRPASGSGHALDPGVTFSMVSADFDLGSA